jgi:hypothetical protein
MNWKLPPKIKVYEALGSVADGRISVEKDLTRGSVKSSRGDKQYIVLYDEKQNAIMTNDSASYWVGYLGYPAIAFLLEIGKIDYDKTVSGILKDIPWKDVNVKFKNDFEKTENYVLESAKNKGFDTNCLKDEVDRIYGILKEMKLEKLGKRILPPK